MQQSHSQTKSMQSNITAQFTACPVCHSSDTQRFEMAYAVNTTTGGTTGLAYTQHVGWTVAGSTSRSQTFLAQRVQPPSIPSRESYAGLIIAGLFSTFVLALLLTILGGVWAGFNGAFLGFCIAVIAGTGITIYVVNGLQKSANQRYG